MEIFKLVGTLVVNGAEKATETVEGMSETVQRLKKKVEEYQKTGMSTSASWRKATQDMKNDTETSADGIESAFRKIGTAITTFVALDKLKDFGAFCIQTAADVAAMESQFQQVFEGVEASATSTLSAIANNAGINENRMKGSFTKIAAFAQTTGMATSDALSLAERAMVAVADSAAFYDRSLEDVTESLQSFLKGNYENDAALGLSCTETTRNAAANELYGKSFNDLSEAQKQLTLLQMVEDANALSGALGQAARESDTWTNQTGNLKQAWADFAAMIGESVLPIAVNIVTKASEIVTWLTEHETIVSLLAVGIGTLTTALIAYNVAQTLATSGMTLATIAGTAFGSVMAFITSPITIVIAAIGALIAIIVLCVQHWDEIKAKTIEVATAMAEKWQEIKEAVSNRVSEMVSNAVGKFNELKSNVVAKFEEIKSNIQDKIESARDIVQKAIEKIRSFLNFSWELPKLKMPHFTISGKFSLNPPSVPSFGISWYKKAYDEAMVLNDPTIFGYSAASGKMLGGGEGNGNEIVAGETHLMNMISEAVAAQNETMIFYLQSLVDMLAEYFPQVIEAAGHDIVTNDGVIVARYAPMFNTALGKISKGKDRGR